MRVRPSGSPGSAEPVARPSGFSAGGPASGRRRSDLPITWRSDAATAGDILSVRNPAGGRRALPRLGAARAHVAVVVERGATHAPRRARPDGYFSGSSPAPARALRYRYGSTARDSAIRTRPRASSRTGRTGPRRWSIRRASAGRTATGRRGARRAGDLRDARRHVHAAKARGPPATGTAARLGTSGVTVHRDDARHRVPGPLRLGLRRRRPLRADAPLRHARRLAPLRRRGPRARPRRHPRRRLQPPRAGRQLPADVLADVLHRHATRTSGARRSTSTARAGAGRANSSLANAGYWIDEFHFDGLRLDATQAILDDSPEHILAAIARRAARGGARARRSIIVAENEPQHARWCARSSRAATVSTRSGTTTSTTARSWPLTGRARPTTPTTAARRRSCLGRQVRLPVPGPALRLAEASGAARRRSACRPAAFVTFLENHDQVANSRARRAPARS